MVYQSIKGSARGQTEQWDQHIMVIFADMTAPQSKWSTVNAF